MLCNRNFYSLKTFLKKNFYFFCEQLSWKNSKKTQKVHFCLRIFRHLRTTLVFCTKLRANLLDPPPCLLMLFVLSFFSFLRVSISYHSQMKLYCEFYEPSQSREGAKFVSFLGFRYSSNFTKALFEAQFFRRYERRWWTPIIWGWGW